MNFYPELVNPKKYKHTQMVESKPVYNTIWTPVNVVSPANPACHLRINYENILDLSSLLDLTPKSGKMFLRVSWVSE